MTTKLSNAFKRELDLNGEKFTLTVSTEGFKLVQKGKRKGIELAWSTLVNGDAALSTALDASLASAGNSLTPAGRSHTKH